MAGMNWSKVSALSIHRQNSAGFSAYSVQQFTLYYQGVFLVQHPGSFSALIFIVFLGCTQTHSYSVLVRDSGHTFCFHAELDVNDDITQFE